ncbi:YeaC family protein [Shewanella amazonensis]|uniref:DUF1315 domain-containing protein n=1 Tax=Shewanella amazonensis (strain ATCC BAA-1098 / SB2B) TaxID=326297 RepID=A1S6C0_SHEAM|nr:MULTISPECIES: DUF1315 family protein [Shewanella]ABL99926.1 conserved hypothetical protein [Shewanella amazonensis SB2B]QYJ77037.1 DUF1315 family protein [Shewanella sp. FJAT-52076]QYK06957.1 DUF1315 family protein [Shewanella zhangzhouensis]
MKDLNQLIDEMPLEVYERMRSAVELGKWEDGSVLTEAQRENAMQVVMLYQARMLDQDEHFTIARGGSINELSKSELKRRMASDFGGETIATFSNDEI